MTALTAFLTGSAIAVACILAYAAVATVRARHRKRHARRYMPEPRATVRAADFPGATADERLTTALSWAQTQDTPPTIVMEDCVTHFRTVRAVNGVRLTKEGRP